MTVVLCVYEDWADRSVDLPTYETAEAAGADVRANFPANERSDGITIAPGERALIPTGLRVEIQNGFELQLRPRSGLALKHGLTLLNAPGTIDSDYRGPLGIIMINLGADPITIDHAERVAQAVVMPVTRAAFESADTLHDSVRGSGGFGSTGLG